VIWKGTLQVLDDDRFDFPVGCGDQIDLAFEVDAFATADAAFVGGEQMFRRSLDSASRL
jgi:hypothetical protein